MKTKEVQEEFKQILLYGYQRGNEDQTLSAETLVKELSDMLKDKIVNAEDQREDAK